MDSSEPGDSAGSGSDRAKVSRLWLLTAPLLVGAWVLFLCLAGGGLLWWSRDDPQAGQAESSPVSDTVPGRGAVKDSLSLPSEAATEPDLSPGSTRADQAEAIVCDLPPANKRSTLAAPLLSPITFATRQDRRGWPLDASLQFTSPISTVQASFSYLGLRNGLTWERVWYFDDEEMLRSRGEWDAGPQGQLTLYAQVEEQGFVPGNYRLEIYLAGELLGRGSFDVVAEDVPGKRPVQVAYTTWDGRQHRLNLLDLEEKQSEVLLEFARQPAWSPDALGLLYVGEAGRDAGNAGLWVLNLGQRQSYQLSQEGDFGSLAWSPHRSLVATSVRPGQAQLPRLRLWQLTENKAYDGPPGQEPAWSPDGRRLAYRGCYDGRWGLNTIEVISNVFNLESIRPLTGGDDRQPAWSRDGQQIAFVRQAAGNQDIYTISYDGSGLRRLTRNPAIDASPAWTPDQRLLFRSRRSGEWGIYMMEADGSEPRRLIDTPSQPDWQPDRLAVSTDVVPVEAIPTKPRVQIPAGHGLLVISNQKNNDEMTFTIDNQEHKIGPYQIRYLPLKPGHYTWTASWPAKISRTGIADLASGQVAYPVVER